MKKLLIILISTLIIGVGLAPWANALYIDSDGATWYTIPELLDYKKNIDQEIETKCGTDRACLINYHRKKRADDSKYLAMFIMEARQFLVTEIKPEAETIKILAFDERIDLKKEGNAEIFKLNIEDVYIGWFDFAQDKNDFNKNYRTQKNNYYNNTVPGAHRIFSRLGVIDGQNWLPAHNEEVEFPIGINSDILNSNGELGYKVADAAHMNMVAFTGYKQCLNDENYSAVAGCRLLISAEKGTGYFAIEQPPIPEDHNDDDNDDNDDNDNVGPNESKYEKEPRQEEPKTQENQKIVSSQKPNIIAKLDQRETINIVKAPDTGAMPNPCNIKTVEFPWWLVGVIALGDAAILWLFWPNGKKSKQKH